MITKYHIQYSVRVDNHWESHDRRTDDPVACEEFLVDLLEHGHRIDAISHEGVELPVHEFDRLLKNAAHELAAKHLANSLGLNAEQVHFRFGYAA